MAQSIMSQLESTDHSDETAEPSNDMFSFDLPDDSPTQAAPPKDPFDFDDTPTSSDLGTGAFSFDETPATEPADPFASLLESTSQVEGDSSAPVNPTTPPAAAPASSPGEFDLDNFSWDDTPAATSPGAANAKPEEDNFDSLFGDMDDAAKK